MKAKINKNNIKIKMGKQILNHNIEKRQAKNNIGHHTLNLSINTRPSNIRNNNMLYKNLIILNFQFIL